MPFPDFPTAAQGPVNSHEVAGNIAAGGGQIILGAQQRLLGGEDGGEIRDPLPILNNRQFEGISRGGGALFQKLGLLLGPQEGYQVILHVLLGAENGILISNEQLLEAGVLNPHQVGDLTVIQDIPCHRGADGTLPVAPVEKIAELIFAHVGR